MEKYKVYAEIKNKLNELGVVYMTTQCIDVDLQNLENSYFETVEEVMDFYRTLSVEDIEERYIFYYGLEGIID